MSRRIGLPALVWAGVRRSRWQTAAAIFAGLVAAGALTLALSLFSSMQHLLATGVERLGGDVIVALPGHRAAVERWMQTGSTDQPVPAQIDVAAWHKRMKEGKVIGLISAQGINLEQGGQGVPSAKMASILVVRLEFWASPMMAVGEIGAALPEAEVLVGEQTTRHVLTDLQPLVRHLSTAAGVALLAAVLITGLLTSIRVGQRRAELGMLRAIGATRRFMIGLTLVESLALALAGSILGVGLALGAIWLLPFSAGVIRWITLEALVGQAGLAMGATILASALAALGPALQTARLDPLEAIRRHQ
ncbi:MAG: FtsX-like permease family protein [Bacillota bacterium]